MMRSGVISIILPGLFILLAAAANAPHARGEQWALLIGVEAYEKVVPLNFTVNDVRQLSDTLAGYGGYQTRHIMELTDAGTSDASKPYAETIKEQLPKWLSKPSADDTMLVYFSGHGFQDAEGKMYLAPLDFEKADAEESGVSIDWLREEIDKCRAKFKLLIIDSCHAGSEKDAGGDEDVITASDLGDRFKSAAGVVTLASCKSEEKSQIWFDKQRSLYSYWLTEGLKGHADRDSNGEVDIDELHRYVDRRVRHTAEIRFARAQTPVRIIGPRVIGVPAIINLRPQALTMLLANMAEHLANLLDEHRLAKVGVLEFTDDSRLQEVLGGQYGLLGKYCGDEIERQLAFLSQDADFRIVDRKQMRNALHQQGGLKLDDLSSPLRLAGLSKQTGDMQVIALGSIRGRRGAVVRLQCELKDTSGGDLIGITGGTAELSEGEWAMMGNSVLVKPEDRMPPADVDLSEEDSDGVIARMDQRAQGMHPLADPEFLKQFNVQIRVAGKTLEPKFIDNDCIVGMRTGDNYTIRIHNNSGELALMRCLVDGLDTTVKVAEKGLATDLWGSPVAHLDEAGYRFLDPQGDELRSGKAVWDVSGFTLQTGKKGKIRQFEIVDASDSLAARQSFSEQIGMITVAFYAPSSGTRQIGTAAGEERELEIQRRKGPRPGKLLGVVHIRYVDSAAFESLSSD